MSARIPPFVEVTPRVRIPAAELSLSYAASGGPGGQNVNKVASKATHRWSAARSAALAGADRDLALARLAHRLTADGDLVLSSDRHRDQPQNVRDVLERLKDVVRAALHREKPRRASHPTRGSKERRLGAKRRRSEVKRGRRGDGD